MEQNESQSKKVPKLLIDDHSDFIFHAAYMAYSKAWDENYSEETRTELNRIMLSFSEGREANQSFYAQLNEFSRDIDYHSYGSFKIKTQKKRAWRKKEQKKARISRHKK